MPRVSAIDRRQQLIEAAFRVMERDGIARASTRSIAAEAGAPLASFHYCFSSKEELLRELTPAVVDDELTAALAAAEPGLDVRESLRAGLRTVWSFAESEPGKQQVLYELTQYALRNPALRDLADWQYERYFELANEYLRRIAETAGVEWDVPIPVLGRMVVTVLDGLTLNWLVDRNTDQALASLDAFAEMLAERARPVARAQRTALAPTA